MEFVPMRFANIDEARQVVSAIRSLVKCPLGTAFRGGELEAVIAGSQNEKEPLLWFSRGASAASKVAGIRLPRGGQPRWLEPGTYTLLLAGSESLPEEPAGPAEGGGPLRVMIIEDHRDTAVMMAQLMESWGCETAVAFSGAEAIAVAARFRPRIVLLDLGLPDRHGYWVAQQIRDHPHDPAMSFIVVTGWSHAADHMSPAAGISHHLVKPVDPDALRTILHGLAPAGAATRSAR
jgi:CheY-like chemotaxis protein